MAACASCGHGNAEDAKFCSECGARLEPATAPAREVRKTVTVVFCDVTGSTALGERLDPEALRSVMTRYFDRMASVLGSHGGTVEKFIGDAVMAVFGIPIVHEDDALRAVRAADEMRRALAELNEDLESEWSVSISTRIGVNTGPVVAGDPGAGQNLVTGDTVNTAARLEQAAAPGEILIGEATLHLVRDAVVVEPMDPLALKGKADAVDAYRLLEVRAGAAGHARRLDSPMVGRERPLRMLADAFEAASTESTCHLFTVFGPAGIGKSRLVREFVSIVGGRAEVLSGRCLSYGDGIAFWPVTEMAIQAAGIAEDDDPEGARAAVRELLRELPDGELVAAHLAGVMGLAGDGPVEAAWALRRFLEAIASRRPVVAVFDDIHWAEPPLLDAIEHVADRSRDVPIVLLCMARPEFLDERQGWGGGMRNATSVHLEPLSEPESDALIENLLGIPALTPEIRERIRAAAQGNPLFVEEVLAMLLDEGVLVQKDDGWVATVDLTTVEVPPAISALLAARLDRLSPAERTLLQTASVIGEVFDRSSVFDLVEVEPRSEVDAGLSSLLRKDLIRPSRSDLGADESFRFRHILLRDSAYDAIPKAERSRLHETFATSLERSLSQRAAEFDEFIGYHLERAAILRRELGLHDDRTEELARSAFAHLRAAGERALRRAAYPSAFALLTHAAELAPADDPARLEIAWEIGRASIETANAEVGERVLREAIERASAAGLDAARGYAEITLVMLRALYDDSADAAEWEATSERWLGRFLEVGDEHGAALAAEQLAYAAWFHERFGGSREAADRAIGYARSSGETLIEVEMLGHRVACSALGPVPFPDVIREAEALLGDARRRGSRRLESQALRILGASTAHVGDVDRGLRRMDEGLAILDELGMAIEARAGVQVNANTLWFAGRLEEAAAVLEDSVAYLDEVGEKAFLSTNAATLAAIEAQRRRWAQAERALALAERVAPAEDRATHILIELAKGLLGIEHGAADADEHLERAIELGEASDSTSFRAARLNDVAEAIAPRRRDDAVSFVREALELALAKADTLVERRARELLDRFGAG
jgi:class 3 adenylate cyclase